MSRSTLSFNIGYISVVIVYLLGFNIITIECTFIPSLSPSMEPTIEPTIEPVIFPTITPIFIETRKLNNKVCQYYFNEWKPITSCTHICGGGIKRFKRDVYIECNWGSWQTKPEYKYKTCNKNPCKTDADMPKQGYHYE